MIEGGDRLVPDRGDVRARGADPTSVSVDPLRTSPRHGAAAGRSLDRAVVVPLPVPIRRGEVVQRWIEIRRRPDRSLVAVDRTALALETRSADGSDRLHARSARNLIAEPIHLVELDFLLAAIACRWTGPCRRATYYAFVSRADRRPDCDVYAWSIRQPMPTIPLPLDPPDPDLPSRPVSPVCDGPRAGPLRADGPSGPPLGLPLAPDDLAWAEATARGAVAG